MNSPEMVARLLVTLEECPAEDIRNEICLMLVLIIEDAKMNLQDDDYYLVREITRITPILEGYLRLHPTGAAYF